MVMPAFSHFEKNQFQIIRHFIHETILYLNICKYNKGCWKNVRLTAQLFSAIGFQSGNHGKILLCR